MVTVPHYVANVVLGWRTYGKLGSYPGGFHEALLNAFNAADSQNRANLAEGFPEYDQALKMGDRELQAILDEEWQRRLEEA